MPVYKRHKHVNASFQGRPEAIAKGHTSKARLSVSRPSKGVCAQK